MFTNFTAVIGLAANPITVAHLMVAQGLRLSGYFNEVWLLPCYCHQFGKEMVDPYHRLRMCELAVEGTPFKICDLEIKNEIEGSSYDTATMLQKEYPTVKFHWVIGMDNALTIDKWINYEEFLELMPFVVVPREGVTVDLEQSHWFLEPPHMYWQQIKWGEEISSTKVRELIAKNDLSVGKLLSPGVLKYIQDHNLYNEVDNEGQSQGKDPGNKPG